MSSNIINAIANMRPTEIILQSYVITNLLKFMFKEYPVANGVIALLSVGGINFAYKYVTCKNKD